MQHALRRRLRTPDPAIPATSTPGWRGGVFGRSLSFFLAVLLSLCACSRTDSAARSSEHRGELLADSPVTDPDPLITALHAAEYRVRYRSTSGVDGSETVVTGAVFVPAGAAPVGGRPVVVFGHGTTGLGTECAPSRHRGLYGFLNVVVPLLARGFVVTAPDYQGLSGGGPDVTEKHAYLDPKTAAYNMIDAVRAARKLVPDASRRWAAIGESQGGQAAWAAAEHAADYGSKLLFMGAAGLSPAADLTNIVPLSQAESLTAVQQIFLPLLLAAARVRHPELDTSTYLHGALWENRDLYRTCQEQLTARKWEVAQNLSQSDSRPKTQEDARRLRAAVAELALPQHRADGPMLVVIGTNDELIRPQWTMAAVQRACRLGDVIDYRTMAGEGHAGPAAIEPAVSWLVERFAEFPVWNSCGSGDFR